MPTDEEIIEAFSHVRGHDTDSYDIEEAVKNIRALFRASLTRVEEERDAAWQRLIDQTEATLDAITPFVVGDDSPPATHAIVALHRDLSRAAVEPGK